MQSSQGRRSICSCIIGKGRKFGRPIHPQLDLYYVVRPACSWFVEKWQTLTAKDAHIRHPRSPQPGSAKVFLRKYATPRSRSRSTVPVLISGHGSEHTSLSVAHAPRLHFGSTRVFSSALSRPATPQGYRLSCRAATNTMYSGHLDAAARQNTLVTWTTGDRIIGSPGINAAPRKRSFHTAAVRRKGGGGGGSAPGGSGGHISTNNNSYHYQFMNPSRNIFGQSEGDAMFDLHDIDYHLFDYLSDEQGKLAISKFLQALRATGLRESDPRLKEAMTNLSNVQNEVSDLDTVQNVFIDRETFRECIADNIILIAKAFRNQFIIPEFTRFTNRIDELFWRAKANTKGKLASYIPQLARFNPESWGLSVCTVDGQRYSLGDALDPICVQSMSKPLTYAMVLDELGPDVVHQYVGQEPSGQAFNTISLDYKNRPHNPMVNAGAVVMCALLKQGMNVADKFDHNQQKLKQLCGNEYVSFNNSVFLSERQSADRNFAIGYYMKENQCFPKGTNLHELLDFYFQLCSVELNCESGAVIAATMANGGICPTTGHKVLEPYCIRDTLSLMLSCGMYDYSGQFAFKVGLPGKSGVSGGIMLVVPNIMGIFMWSPPLDHYGNSVRGIQFCEDLVRSFNFHNYDNLRHTHRKTDPRVQTVDHQSNLVVNLLFSAYNGDVTAIRRCALLGMDMSHADYDGRTALHVASAEGHTAVVKFLLEKCNCSPFLVDRWGFMPIDDAKRFQHQKTVEFLESFMEKETAKGNNSNNSSSSLPNEVV